MIGNIVSWGMGVIMGFIFGTLFGSFLIELIFQKITGGGI